MLHRHEWFCLALFAIGCGEVGGECDPDAPAAADAAADAVTADTCVGAPDAAGADAAVADAVVVDAAAADAAVPCVWSSITPVAELNTGDPEVCPMLAADGLTVYFARRPGPTYEIWSAGRSMTSFPFGPPAVVPELDTAGDDLCPFLSGDGLEIYWMSKAANGDIWRGTRSMPSGSFTATAPVDVLNHPSAEDDRPRLSPDGLAIVFASNRPDGLGGFDIYRATRPGPSSPFGPPALVVELSSPADEMGGSFSPDGATFYFASNRLGTAGALDIMRAPHAAGVFGPPVFVAELNTGANDFDPFLAPDAKLYFASDRIAPGNHDLFTVTCP